MFGSVVGVGIVALFQPLTRLTHGGHGANAGRLDRAGVGVPPHSGREGRGVAHGAERGDDRVRVPVELVVGMAAVMATAMIGISGSGGHAATSREDRGVKARR